MVGTNIVDPTALINQFSTALRLVTCYLPRSDFARPTPATKSEEFRGVQPKKFKWFKLVWDERQSEINWLSQEQRADCPMFRTETLDTINCISPFATVDLISLFRYPSHGTNESHTRMTTPTDYYNTTPVDGIENTHHLTAIYPLLFLLLEWGRRCYLYRLFHLKTLLWKQKSRPPTRWWSTCTLLPFYLMFGSIYLQTLAVKNDMR